MKILVLSKLEFLALISVPLAFGLTAGIVGAYLFRRFKPKRRLTLEERIRADLLEYSTK